MTSEQKFVFGIAGVVVGSGLAYWAYLYLQDRENAPDITDVIEQGKSLISRALTIGEGTIGDVTGTSTYFDKATTLLAKLEGFSPKTYNDVGKLAIGYGHDLIDGDGYNSDSVISESEAKQLLTIDLRQFDGCINRTVKTSLNDNQRAALLVFVYNIGCGAFTNSTMLKRINAGDFDGASQEFSRWVYAGGVVSDALVSRRQDEMDLFVTV